MPSGPVPLTRRTGFVTLVWTVPVRVLDISRCGCRLESPRWLATGTSGQLRLSLGQRRHEDDIRIARCQLREGAGASYAVGAELLRTRRLNGRSIRLAIGHLIGEQDVVVERSRRKAVPVPDRESESETLVKGVGRAPPSGATTET